MKDQNLTLSQVKNVLVVRLDKIGDVVLTTPFLRELRKNLPGAWITLVIRAETYELVANCPYINEVLVYNCRVGRRGGKIIRNIYALIFALFYLWKRRFDLAIIPRWDVDYYNATVLAYLSGAKKRIAYSEYVNVKKHKLNKGYDKLLTHPIMDKRLRHEVERNLEVIKFLGGRVEDDSLELWLDEDDIDFAAKTIAQCGIGANALCVCFAIGSTLAKKIWPMDKYAELAKWLIKNYAAHIILLGNCNEEAFAEEIKAKVASPSLVDMVGNTTLRQAAALIRRCKLYIGSDNGLKHISATMNVPVIEISHWNRRMPLDDQYGPYRFRPWRVKYYKICPQGEPLNPCKEASLSIKPHYIAQVTVEDVKEAIKKLLHPDDQRTNAKINNGRM